MKKNVTYIAHEQFVALIAASGLPCVEKAGWLKVCGATGRRLYVPKTKRVGRVDLVGFPDGEGVRALGGESFGSVTHQLDMSRTEAEILATFGALLDALHVMPAAEPKARAPRAKAEPGEEKKSIRSRLSLIKRVARERGLSVASSTLIAADEEVPTSEEVELLPDAQ